VLIKFLIILVLLAIVMRIVYLFARIHTIECVRDRPGEVSATITHSGINYCKKELIPAGELLRAELEAESSQNSKGESSTIYRVRLITTTYTTFLTKTGSFNYEDISIMVEQINYFIQESTQKSMLLTQDDRLGAYMMGGMFGIVGSVFLYMISTYV
jgi:hypothetical protein